jgi:predicted enzyme related to lactoylglutathione lyase
MRKSPFNPVGWFQIPVHDLDRAVKFYEKVFGYSLKSVPGEGGGMGWFPSTDGAPGSSGCLVKHPKSRPSLDGTLVHFESPSGDLTNELKRVEPAGGKVLQPKTSIGEFGFYAFVEDTEGNRIGIHSKE